MMGPAWLDPKYMDEARARQLANHMAEHEEAVRERERARERRRLEPLFPTTGVKWCTQEADWKGCTL